MKKRFPTLKLLGVGAAVFISVKVAREIIPVIQDDEKALNVSAVIQAGHETLKKVKALKDIIVQRRTIRSVEEPKPENAWAAVDMILEGEESIVD